jgi:hypothetical protein
MKAHGMFDAIEPFWIVDLHSFERVETLKHERIRKEALTPPRRHNINSAIEQKIVE